MQEEDVSRYFARFPQLNERGIEIPEHQGMLMYSPAFEHVLERSSWSVLLNSNVPASRNLTFNDRLGRNVQNSVVSVMDAVRNDQNYLGLFLDAGTGNPVARDRITRVEYTSNPYETGTEGSRGNRIHTHFTITVYHYSSIRLNYQLLTNLFQNNLVGGIQNPTAGNIPTNQDDNIVGINVRPRILKSHYWNTRRYNIKTTLRAIADIIHDIRSRGEEFIDNG